MSAKRSNVALLSSNQRIRRAKRSLKAMSKARQIDLMVEAGVMTPEQVERVEKKLVDVRG